ncbi:unnamed protein product [Mycena citricolor]|uniref:Uncharacterized protein n=1 Tax=Mycena citricolor TaxID=2018698 RepID=A0AAD2GV21_9AGAR|nr:unnamed protein product [Mycena citricolor]
MAIAFFSPTQNAAAAGAKATKTKTSIKVFVDSSRTRLADAAALSLFQDEAARRRGNSRTKRQCCSPEAPRPAPLQTPNPNLASNDTTTPAKRHSLLPFRRSSPPPSSGRKSPPTCTVSFASAGVTRPPPVACITFAPHAATENDIGKSAPVPIPSPMTEKGPRAVPFPTDEQISPLALDAPHVLQVPCRPRARTVHVQTPPRPATAAATAAPPPTRHRRTKSRRDFPVAPTPVAGKPVPPPTQAELRFLALVERSLRAYGAGVEHGWTLAELDIADKENARMHEDVMMTPAATSVELATQDARLADRLRAKLVAHGWRRGQHAGSGSVSSPPRPRGILLPSSPPSVAVLSGARDLRANTPAPKPKLRFVEAAADVGLPARPRSRSRSSGSTPDTLPVDALVARLLLKHGNPDALKIRRACVPSSRAGRQLAPPSPLRQVAHAV